MTILLTLLKTLIFKRLKIFVCLIIQVYLKYVKTTTPQRFPLDITETEVIRAIERLPSNKTTTLNDIPASILKDSVSAYSKVLTNILNKCLQNDMFLDILKHADITSVFKKGDSTKKENY